MDTNQLTDTAKSLSMGNKILGGSAIVALIATFLPWYTVDVAFVDSYSWAGRQFTFGWLGMVLLVGAAALVLLPSFGVKRIEVGSLATEQIALIAAGLGALLWLIRLVSLPGFNVFDTIGRGFGLYVAILAAGGVVYGIIASMKEKGIAMPTVNDVKVAASNVSTSSTAAAAPAPPAPGGVVHPAPQAATHPAPHPAPQPAPPMSQPPAPQAAQPPTPPAPPAGPPTEF